MPRNRTFLGISSGGGGGSRTPVRKHFIRSLSGRRRSFTFPHHGAERHAPWLGSFILSCRGQSLARSRAPLSHAQARLVVLPGRTAAIKQRRELRYRRSLIYKLPVLWMSGASARYSCPHVPVETSTPPDRNAWPSAHRAARGGSRQYRSDQSFSGSG